MEAEGGKKGATAAAEEGKMVEEQGEKGVVVVLASQSEKGKMVAEQGEKGVVVVASQSEKGKMVAEQEGEKGLVVASESEKGKTVEEQGEKAVAASEAEQKGTMMVAEQGEKAVAASEAEKAAAETGGRLINVKSSDGKVYSVSKAAAQMSGLLSGMIQEGFTDKDDGVLVIPNSADVEGSTLVTVFEYCNKHAEADADTTKPDSDLTAGSTSAGVVISTAASKDLEAWDRDFLDRLTMDALYDLFHASSFLDIRELFEAVANKAADMIKGKTTEQIREAFNIVNDLTPEQEAEAVELNQKNVWDFAA